MEAEKRVNIHPKKKMSVFLLGQIKNLSLFFKSGTLLTNGENSSPALNIFGLFKVLSHVKKLPITKIFN